MVESGQARGVIAAEPRPGPTVVVDEVLGVGTREATAVPAVAVDQRGGAAGAGRHPLDLCER